MYSCCYKISCGQIKADQEEIVCISDNSTFFLIFLPSEQYEIGLP